MILCQLRFINCNKCTTLVEEIDNVKLCVCVRGYRVNGKSLLSSQFCCEMETTLKKITWRCVCLDDVFNGSEKKYLVLINSEKQCCSRENQLIKKNEYQLHQYYAFLRPLNVITEMFLNFKTVTKDQTW